ncbi:hypothetical protein HDU96_010139 [Phlyctochytrium bullatum]|nr:hypothetical protein HDU96_010139 [Phlyctochytrium bullatum]
MEPALAKDIAAVNSGNSVELETFQCLASAADAIASADIIENILRKEDWDAILELGIGGHNEKAMLSGLPTAVKSAFTRTYNKATHPQAIFSQGSAKVKASKITDTPDLEEAVEVEEFAEDDEEGEDNENIEEDSMIKKRKAGESASEKKSKARPAKRRK